MMAGEEGVRQILHLFRAVLRCHRRVLPPPMRVLGDAYVRDEFDAHKKAKASPEQWAEFGRQWISYVESLSRSGTTDSPGPSGELHPVDMEAMSDDQLSKLDEIKRSIVDLHSDGPSEPETGSGRPGQRPDD